MKLLTSILLLYFFINSIKCFNYNNIDLNIIEKFNRRNFFEDNPGGPLYLTPLIHEHKIEEAKALSKINHTQFNTATSYSGYLTVNKSDNSNLFFWFTQAKADWEKAPVLLWLQGGPGASSLFGLFVENGPYQMYNEKTVSERKYSWHANHNLLYIDNPVGSGYSFTDSENGYANTEIEITLNLYNALLQFFQLFSELESNKFFVTGESYAGKYVPNLAYYIHKMNKVKNNKHINLSGLAIGNGFVDPVHQILYGDYLYQLGLIELEDLTKAKHYEKNITTCISKNHFEDGFDLLNEYIGYDGTSTSFFKNITGFTSHYNFADSEDTKTEMKYLIEFINLDEIRKAIHVGNKTFNDNVKTNLVRQHLKRDILGSTIQTLGILANNYSVLIYNGQLDIICAYRMTTNYLKHLKFDGADEYKTANREIWKVENEVAGYVKKAKLLTQVLVLGAGHMVPHDQPKWSSDMISRFTSGKSFN